jgi:hypothetical protein
MSWVSESPMICLYQPGFLPKRKKSWKDICGKEGVSSFLANLFYRKKQSASTVIWTSEK